MFNHFKPTPKKAIAGGGTPQNKQRTYIKFGYFLGDPVALARARHPKADPIPAESPVSEPILTQIPALIRPKKIAKKASARSYLCKDSSVLGVNINFTNRKRSLTADELFGIMPNTNTSQQHCRGGP
ncbi:hypothetical protein [Flavobacterium subsaxonicum]|uniref:Uncharacterized protein n=1 Tax=Flavobacterium subsaxonicum WB 4.1-42 = DSM 21790 TaxID=1121898 RepID=A0A0A2MJX6_9FLAO|nr:hypothetical protein [Flavobacterium subsaxonicum]KGO92947.1 hypothetical protein Q766_09975 [Flavobacterium subsaxonicum WB 4.1-42 = DSM 21790]